MSGLLFCLTGASLTIAAAPWDLDPTFGDGGKVIWSPNGNTQSLAGTGMSIQADGKIVMVGGYGETAGSTAFVVARFNTDGSLDTTFGLGGWTTITFGGTVEYANSVAVQPDGKIVAGGHMVLPTVGQEMAIARLNPDGTLDTTFSEDGKVTVGFTTNEASPLPDYLTVIRVASGGKIVFGGGGGPGPNILYYATLGRLNSDGSLDTTFDTDGRINNGLGSGWVRDLLTNTDGSIYVGRDASAQFSSGVGVTKYNDDGSVGWNYSKTVQPGCYMSLNGIAAQPDGKLVVVGSDNCIMSAFRLHPSGAVDNTFGTSAVTPNGRALAVAIQPDGKILATVLFGGVISSYGFSLIRYNPDGSLDSGFGSGGIARLTTVNGSGFDIAILPDGKVLVGGAAGYRFGIVRYMGAAAVPGKRLFDFDGDGKSDFTVFRPSTNVWYELFSSNQPIGQFAFGATGDIPAPADYDGDGKADEAIFRPSTGTWWYQSSIDNAQLAVQFGSAGDIPRPFDFDGDGKDDFVVYRPSNSIWYRLGSSGAVSVKQFGIGGDKPVIGDFDGDGKGDLAIYRPSTGTWWYAASSANEQSRAVQWGVASDIPAPADFDGDGKTDLAVFRPSDGVWYVLRSSNGTYMITQFGVAGDRPIPADYDGDGATDIAVFRPSTGVWYLLQSTAGSGGVQWGASTDIAIPGAFVP